MNGTGVKGGAFGFRVSSINKLVDTKSLHNTTLLHFLERTVSKHFTDMEHFLDELNAPAEAYRGQSLRIQLILQFNVHPVLSQPPGRSQVSNRAT